MNARRRPRPPRRARGFALIVALLMLAVIGLAAAAIMRNATSGDQAANANRLQTQAGQYAQLALGFCEAQLARPPETRRVAVFAAASSPAWAAAANWTDARAPRAAHTLAAAEIGGAAPPRVAPQCMIEAAGLADTYVVTARGFSADFKASPGSGTTRNGSVVWLQSTIHVGPAGGARRRLWQQWLSTPL